MQHCNLLHAFEHKLQLLKLSSDLLARSTFLNEREGRFWTEGGATPNYASPLAKLGPALSSSGIAGLDRLADLRRRSALIPAPDWRPIFTWPEHFEKCLTIRDDRFAVSTQIPFAPALQPFLADFVARRDVRLHRLFRATAIQSLIDGLARQLSKICAMTLYCTLSDEHGVSGETPEIYSRFCKALNDGRWRELARQYPVMARLMTERTVFFGEAVDELVDRLDADRPVLDHGFLPGCLDWKIADVDPGMGDTHNFARCVMRVQFDGGAVLYYKPKPLANERWFNDILAPALRACNVPLGSVAVLDRGTYGWARDAREKNDAESLKDGSSLSVPDMARITAVFYWLNGTDFHFENLVNGPETCHAIDLETLFNSLPWLDEADGAEWRRWTFLSTDMLRARFGYEGSAADASGLYAESFDAPFPVYDFEVTQEGGLRLKIWRPDAEGRSTTGPIEAPFPPGGPSSEPSLASAIPEALARVRKALPDVLRQLPQNAICRFVLRPTMFYARLFQRLYMPRFLADAAHFSIELNGLCAGLRAFPEQRRPCMMALFESEIAQLQRGDIPYFGYSPFALSLRADGDVVVDTFFVESGMSLVMRKLAAIDEDDVREEVGLVLASEALAKFSWTEARRRQSLPADPVDGARGSDGNAISQCCALIANEIVAAARRLPNGRTRWLGHIGDAAAKSIVPHLCDDSYFGGYWGVMSFLTRCACFFRKAGEPLSALENFLTEETEIRRDFAGYAPSARSVVGLDGVAGQVIGYLRLIDADPHRWLFLEDRLAECLATLEPDRLDIDPVPDVIAGNAGLILALSLLASQPWVGTSGQMHASIARILAHSIDTVLAKAIAADSGTFWRSPLSQNGLIGFAHGNAGYLVCLAQCLVAYEKTGLRLSTCQIEKIRSTLRQALVWERANRRGADWPDLRPELGANAMLNNSWCHGLSGLGLSRIALLRTEKFRGDSELVQELTDIVTRLLEQPGQAIFDTACCGAAGEWELLVSAGRMFPETGWLEQGQRRAAAAAVRISANGGYRGFMGSVTPIGLSPSLYQGAAGIGDVLLASHNPARCNLYGLLST